MCNDPDAGIVITEENVFGRRVVTFSRKPSASFLESMKALWKGNGYVMDGEGHEDSDGWYVILVPVSRRR